MRGAQIDQLLDPAYLAELASLDLAEVRRRRSEATEVESALSYLRRLVQGRLDIVVDERHRRDAGEGPVAAGDLVERLPSILGERVHAPGTGRLSAILDPAGTDPALCDELDDLFPARLLSGLAELDDAALERAVSDLERYERQVSDRRRALHHVIDTLQEEIVRRYRSGEATVDSLLH